MSIYSFHLANLPPLTAAGAMVRQLKAPGLVHAEVFAGMELGAPIVSPRRMQLKRTAVFAHWEDERSLTDFLTGHPFGRKLDQGWHVRLQFLRRWGKVSEFAELPESAESANPHEPVVAVTLARLRLPELPRFIRWGRPVETQIRDHPEATLAMAGIRLPRTVSTFSIWTSTRAMTGMVSGRDAGDSARRHTEAMTERERRDFHLNSRRCAFGRSPNTAPGKAGAITSHGLPHPAADTAPSPDLLHKTAAGRTRSGFGLLLANDGGTTPVCGRRPHCVNAGRWQSPAG